MIISTFVVPYNGVRQYINSYAMKPELYKINLTREQLTFVQVALLEAQISAFQDKRKTDAERYMETYKYIGTEKRRVLTHCTAKE